MKFIFTLILLSAGISSAAPHQFEDGFVERTLAVVVRDNLATAEYSIGLNESTIETLLAEWESESRVKQDSEPIPEAKHPQSSSSKIDSARISTQENTANPTAKPKPGIASPTTQAPSITKNSKFAPIVDQPPSTTPAPDSAQSSTDEVEHVINPEVLGKFQKALATQLTQRIQINSGEQELEIKSVSVEAAPRHPFALVVKFQFEIPNTETSQIRIVDQCFAGQNGAVRYSLKALGSTILLKSNVAPIIVRAKRIELQGLSKKETTEHTSISVRLATMSTSKTDD